VRARRRATLAARIPAAVVELPHREGERVAQGALLVRLDDAALRSGVAAAEAALHAAETDRARIENLVKKNAATPRERDEAEARAAAARAALSAAQDNLAYAVLRAPFAGTVAARQADLGDVVQPGMPLIEVEGEGGLEVQATVEADQAASLKLGQKLRAHVDGQAAPLEAIVRAVAQAGDPTTHRFEVRADLPAAGGLRSGLFARLALPSSGGEPRLVIPTAAAFERGGLTGVYVAEGGRARLRFIAPGARSGDALEVRAGLVEGEQVALAPDGLADGTPLVAAPGAPRTEPR
jgi:RND family efflux transporter MFP subunit